MNSVDRVKEICKERKIAISKLEKACGFANGYIGQLRKGAFPDDRLQKIAAYLEVDPVYLMSGDPKEKPATIGDGLEEKRQILNGLFDQCSQEDQDRVIDLLKLLSQRQ